MNRGHKRSALLVLCLLCLFGSAPAGAVKLNISDDTFLDLHGLLQPFTLLTYTPGEGTAGLLPEFYIHRARLILGGQVTKWVGFYLDTDTPDWGKGGTWTQPDFLLQDAFVHFNLFDWLRIYAGYFPTPFVHNAAENAATLQALDYHNLLLGIPAGSKQNGRDDGVLLRGLLFNKLLEYRVAVTAGVTGTQSHIPRFSGRVAVNLFDAEEDFFYSGGYFGKKKVLSFGVAADYQPDALSPGKARFAAGGDAFFDLPVGQMRLCGQLDLVYYGEDPGSANPIDLIDPASPAGAGHSLGLGGDVGLLIGRFEPLVAADFYSVIAGPISIDAGTLDLHGGLNFWLSGHNASVKLDVGVVKPPGGHLLASPLVGTLQAQFYL
jgi:hypothetical protein